jgi:hypothetical protein
VLMPLAAPQTLFLLKTFLGKVWGGACCIAALGCFDERWEHGGGGVPGYLALLWRCEISEVSDPRDHKP